jgi:apolipoprotein N-acyltransferase
MEQVVSSTVLIPSGRWSRLAARARLEAPTLTEWVLAALSTSLLILSFPNFEKYLLAWVSLVPLLLAIARRPSPLRALVLGWVTGTVFFYATCYWLTYSMIHYGGLPAVLAYLLLIPGAVVVGVFPGLFAVLVALAIRRWGPATLLLAPVFWTALEWSRLGVTGQLWNAMGYSQAYNPYLIQAATWGGVYAVSFLILAVNAALTLLLIRQRGWAIAAAVLTILFVALVIFESAMAEHGLYLSDAAPVKVVALQPNVPMNLVKSPEETKELLERHLALSRYGLEQGVPDDYPKLVVWPESPMNFTYASDHAFQEMVANFTKENHTSLLFNSLEPAPGGGSYNSALLINEEGRLISQYDKIRLMPFGEYVPLPQWLPGASLISAIVGEFTPGTNYTLMPVGGRRVGVFICIESAYPWIARRFVSEGADGLINISNDGYLGPTAVMRQHLANVIFRAVENSTPILRVTNTGLSAQISYDGTVLETTGGFQADVRVWSLNQTKTGRTFYTRHGDLFVQACAVITLAVLLAVLFSKRRSLRNTA